MQVHILLGSNIGNKKQFIYQAIEHIEKKIGVIEYVSSFYLSPPWEMDSKEDFINCALRVNTPLSAQKLLITCKGIEKIMGRKQTNNKTYIDRIIDIDILYIQKRHIVLNNLVVPHPMIPYRKFTLIPLVEMEPYFIHPLIKKNNKELLAICKDPSQVLKLEKQTMDIYLK